MDKLELLARAWIDCDPNRAGAEPGSGWHADDLQEARENVVIYDANRNAIGVSSQDVSDDMRGVPVWRWFLPRAVALEQYLEERGYVIVRIEQVGKGRDT